MKGGVGASPSAVTTVDEVRRVAAVKGRPRPAPSGKPRGPKGGVKKG
jgi:hypothetical protein